MNVIHPALERLDAFRAVESGGQVRAVDFIEVLATGLGDSLEELHLRVVSVPRSELWYLRVGHLLQRVVLDVPGP